MSRQHTAHKFLFTAFKTPVGLHRVNSSTLDTINVVKYMHVGRPITLPYESGVKSLPVLF